MQDMQSADENGPFGQRNVPLTAKFMSCTFDAMITPINVTNSHLQTHNRYTVCCASRGQQADKNVCIALHAKDST